MYCCTIRPHGLSKTIIILPYVKGERHDDGPVVLCVRAWVVLGTGQTKMIHEQDKKDYTGEHRR